MSNRHTTLQSQQLDLAKQSNTLRDATLAPVKDLNLNQQNKEIRVKSTVLSNKVERLAFDAQILVHSFVEICKIFEFLNSLIYSNMILCSNIINCNNEESHNLLKEQQELRCKFNIELENFNFKKVKLKPNWEQLKELCLSIQEAINDFNCVEVDQYLSEINKIITLVINLEEIEFSSNLQHTENVTETLSFMENEVSFAKNLKSLQLSFPYFILKLLSVIKSLVKEHMEKELSINSASNKAFSKVMLEANLNLIIETKNDKEFFEHGEENLNFKKLEQSELLNGKEVISNLEKTVNEKHSISKSSSLQDLYLRDLPLQISSSTANINKINNLTVNVKQAKEFFEEKAKTTQKSCDEAAFSFSGLKKKNSSCSESKSNAASNTSLNLFRSPTLVKQISKNNFSTKIENKYQHGNISSENNKAKEILHTQFFSSEETDSHITHYSKEKSISNDSVKTIVKNKSDAGHEEEKEARRKDTDIKEENFFSATSYPDIYQKNSKLYSRNFSNNNMQSSLVFSPTRVMVGSSGSSEFLIHESDAKKKSAHNNGTAVEINSELEKMKKNKSTDNLKIEAGRSLINDINLWKVEQRNSFVKKSIVSPLIIENNNFNLTNATTPKKINESISRIQVISSPKTNSIVFFDGQGAIVDEILNANDFSKDYTSSPLANNNEMKPLNSEVSDTEFGNAIILKPSSIADQDIDKKILNEEEHLTKTQNQTFKDFNANEIQISEIESARPSNSIAEPRIPVLLNSSDANKPQNTALKKEKDESPIDAKENKIHFTEKNRMQLDAINTAVEKKKVGRQRIGNDGLPKNISPEYKDLIKTEKIPLGTDNGQLISEAEQIKSNESSKSTPSISKEGAIMMCSPFVSPSKQFNLSNLPPLADHHTQIILIPLNGMFELCYLNLSKHNLLGRSNTQKHERFKAFPTQVVSRSHVEIWEDNDTVFIKDVGSSSGTFLNGVRLSFPGVVSSAFEIQSGDIVQLGKDYVDPKLKGQKITVVNSQHRCVKMQLVIVLRNDRLTRKSKAQPLEIPITQGSLVNIANDTSAAKKKTETSDYEIELESTKNFEQKIADQQEKWEKGQKVNSISPQQNQPVVEQSFLLKSSVTNFPIPPSNRNKVSLSSTKTQEKRESLIMTAIGTNSRIKKLQLSTEKGVEILNVNVKGWESRKHILIEDLRPKYSKTRNLDLVQTNPQKNVFTLYVAGGPCLGTLEYTNNLKLLIQPAANFIELYHQQQLSNPTSSAARTSIHDEIPVPKKFIKKPGDSLFLESNVSFCITGNFKEGTWIIIMKFTNSREQRLIGESKGRQLVRKNVRESRWICKIDFEDSIYSQLLHAASCYLTLSAGEH
ncbi:hypothetical protein HK099_005620 [Clydaea vesicula]|uniref:FHA domain-containing protein n=1 Tax=Clydaea vesicula TaxID=447962 RepID=A0AAD5TYI7_9FUNG|nr:hypothetical protein HK099_005620 [Clydaea vesicula]